jgi:glycosyltransferase involved in cell wall biosynthesis
MSTPGSIGGDGTLRPPRVLIVEPAASGGLAAHVRMEREILRAGGAELPEAGVRIASRPSPADLRTVRSLRRLLRGHGTGAQEGSISAIHAHGLRAGALAALARGPRGRTPRLVVTLHNRVVGGRAVRTLGQVLVRIIRSRADAVLTVSPDLDALVRGVPHLEHAIVPASPSPPTPGPTVPDGALRPEPLQVLVVARLAPQKGLDDLLDAVAILTRTPGPDGPPDLLVRIAGDGPQHEHLSARITAEDLPVELLGRREDVPALLAASDLVVSSALWEGQPVFLQEALRAGRPLVATDAGGTRLVTGEAATLVPVADPGALAAAIRDMVPEAAREAASRAATARARALPGRRELTAQLEAVLGISLDTPGAGTAAPPEDAR